MTAIRHPQTPRAALPADDLRTDERLSHVWHQPDGYRWLDEQGRTHGPFESLDDALANMAGVSPSQSAPGGPAGVI